ncbi:MAG: glycerol-3-phosphate acyltransferase [Chloroflexi bacterium]|nr:glycerol-3-phosphate acyltransferase [Chloroflexota bacterium]
MLFLYILFIVAFYFFGAIPFMILIGRIRGFDLTHEPDLHHALWYKVGRNWGILGFMLDVVKGILPILIGYLLALPLWVTALAALASLCGQMWPVFRKFDGERGNTVSLGIVATLSIAYGAPLILIVALCFAALGFIIRTSKRWKESGDTLNERLKLGGSPSLALPLGVMLGYASCPVTSWILGQPQEITYGLAGVIILILIRRVTAGIIQDLRNSKHPLNVIINRLLFDRSEI